ncbi:uncharacterized protein LOC119170885 isoform X3 [Rhipicephalus microplus]|uniref:uncharacterized protein LOC119170885 isoform X3 n=1 Tax=Rhipicephalus microplus TaxID=6941 RepID=UPI003F6C9F1A
MFTLETNCPADVVPSCREGSDMQMQTACCCVRCWNSKGGRYYLGCCYGNLTQEGAEQKYCHAGLPRRRRL